MGDIRLKRRSTAGAAGAPAALKSAEPAYNMADDTLYIGHGDDGGGNATSIKAIAGLGAFVTLSTTQTISGAKAFSTNPTGVTQAADNNSTQLATTAFVIGQAGSTSPVMNGTAAVGASLRYARADHVHPTDTSRAPLASPTFTGTPAAPTAANGTNTTQIATTAYVLATRLNQLTVPNGAVNFNSQLLSGVATPVSGTDAANKAYVDSAVQGLDTKESVRIATTANITLSGLTAIDGITPVAGNRILVKDQTTGSANGIYLAASGAWSRAPDAVQGELTPNAFVFVEEGTVNANSGWTLTNTGTITVGTTALTFAQFSGAGQINAGAGMTKTGNTLDVVGTANRITANADSIDIAATYVGQTSITTLGTIATGTWNATTISVAKGGTGATTLTGLVKGNGTSAFTAAVVDTDYLAPASTIDGGTF